MPYLHWCAVFSLGIALWLHQAETKRMGWAQCSLKAEPPNLFSPFRAAVDKHIFDVWSFCVKFPVKCTYSRNRRDLDVNVVVGLILACFDAYCDVIMSSATGVLFCWWPLVLTNRGNWSLIMYTVTHTPTYKAQQQFLYQFSVVFFVYLLLFLQFPWIGFLIWFRLSEKNKYVHAPVLPATLK